MSTGADDLIPYVHVLPRLIAVGKHDVSASAVPSEQGTFLELLMSEGKLVEGLAED